MSENSQKIKLLKILDYLRTESSKEHPATTKQIISYLSSIGTTCDRRTLYKDMEMLIESGSDIIKTEYGRENAYYMDSQSLSLAELKIMIDCVQAANFITDSKTDELVKKILSMAGVRKQEIVRSNRIVYNNHKHTNEEIYDNIEQIEYAIAQKKQISFYYFNLDYRCRRSYRKDKARYFADPIALVYSEDNYYLLAYSREKGKRVHYRVDRMDTMQIEDVPICDEAKVRKRSSNAYSEQIFKMYQGETVEITLVFDPELANYIFDKFGEETKIMITADNRYQATLPIQTSPPFWGWLLQFAGKMEIVSPESALKQYYEQLRKALGGNTDAGEENH